MPQINPGAKVPIAFSGDRLGPFPRSRDTISTGITMKTAYELAMERLNRTAPLTPLTEEQKREIAELESRYKARIAEREITLQQQIAAARAQGDWAKAGELEQQLATERRKLQEELETRKEKIRQGRP